MAFRFLKNITLFFALLTTSISFAEEFYWIGGAGSYSDTLNWSLTSGGPFHTVLPGASDTIHFDDNSGLTPASSVEIDIAINVHSIFMETISNSFIMFSPVLVDHSIFGSIRGNASGVDFTGNWGEIQLLPINFNTVESSGIIWIQNFVIDGDSLTFIDNFNITNGLLEVTSGVVVFSPLTTVTCSSFSSNTAFVREFEALNVDFIISLGQWDLGGTNFTFDGASSEITLGQNLGSALFNGGGQTYGDLISQTATELELSSSANFTFISLLNSSTLFLNSGITVQFDSLNSEGFCSAELIFEKLGVGTNPLLVKTGFPNFSISGLTAINVDASAVGSSEIIYGNIVGSSAGWDLGNGKLFWIGNSGAWNQGSNWSFSSGGVSSGCIPSIADTVIFDVNSFASTNQTVTVLDTAFAKTMIWDAALADQSLILDSNIYIENDIVLQSDMTFIRSFVEAGVVQVGAGFFNVNGSSVDVNLYTRMEDTTDIWQLNGDLFMSDTSTLMLINGKFETGGFDMTMGNVLSINDPSTADDKRVLTFGSSTIRLAQRFVSLGDTNFVLNAGTSHLIMADASNYEKTILTEDLIFNEATLNFLPLNVQQVIGGSNSFNKLRILAGSDIRIAQNSTQTVLDSLLILGTCFDSVFVRSNGASQAELFKGGAANQYRIECVNFEGINASGESLDVFFSTNVANNTSITFNTALSADAEFTVNGPFCFGDTVLFTNNSTAFSGDNSDLNFRWYFNDGSGDNPADTIFYFTNPSNHVFLIADSIPVVLEAFFTNGCKDVDTNFVVITKPEFNTSTNSFSSDLCPGHFLELSSTSGSETLQYQYFYNGVSLGPPSATDTLYSTTTFQNQDSIIVTAFDQGCASDTSYLFTYNVYADPVYNFTSSVVPQEICAGDSITFNGTATDTLEFRFLVNNAGVTPFQFLSGSYTTDQLQDGDEVFLIVNDLFGCKDTSATFSVVVNPLPSTSLAHSASGNAICFGDEIIFTGSGADTYEFLLDGVTQQGPAADNTWSSTTILQGEVVSVIGYTTDGCAFDAPQTFSYFVTPSPATTLSSSLGSTACVGDQVLFTGLGATSYEFFVNGTSVQAPSTDNTFASATLNDGDEVTVVGSSLGCSLPSSPIEMDIFPAPSTVLINDLATQSICQGTEVTFTASGATNYEFFLNGGSLGAPSATNTYVSSSLTNGDIISVTGSIGSCSNGGQQQFTVLPNPNVEIFSNNATNVICDGDAINFIASGAQNYTFSIDGLPVQGPGPAANLVSPTLSIGSNDIVVFGTAPNGCSSTSSLVQVINNPIPTVTLSSSIASNEICAGESIMFSAAGGDSYQFLLNGAPQTSLSPLNNFSSTSLSDGDQVTVVGSLSGCTNTSNLINVTVNPVPLISLTNDFGLNQYCEDVLVTYTAAGATEYEFFVNGVSQGVSSVLDELNSSTFPNGTINLTVVGEELGCVSSVNSTINVFPLPVPSLNVVSGQSSFCSGEVIEFEAGGGSEYQFFVNGIPSTPNSFVSTYSSVFSDGDVVSVDVTTVSGCSSTGVAPILTVFPNPTISITSSNGVNNICTGDLVDIEAFGGNTYEFFLNGASLGAPSVNNAVTLSNLQTGDEVFVIGADVNCNSTSSLISFTSFGTPNVNLTNTLPANSVCDDEPLSLLASGASNYQFFVNGNPIGGFSTNDQFNQLVNNGDEITVVGELNGCESLPSAPLAFTVFNYPTITVSNDAAANTICLGDTVNFSVTGALEYQFELNGLLTETNTSGSWSTDLLNNADVVSIIGLNGQCASPISLLAFTVNSMNLDFDVTPSTFICEGELVTFTGSGADSYEFLINDVTVQASSADNTFDSNTLSSNDIVTFIGTNSSTGCVQNYQDFVVMTVVSQPAISADGPLQFCDGDSVVLFSNSTYGNQWLFDGNPIAGGNEDHLTVFDSGDYSLETVKGGNGEFWSIGKNSSGVHGNGNNFNSTIAETTDPSIQFESFSAGYEFILAKSITGEVYSWGKNNSGQLGNGTFTSSTSPLLLAGVVDADVVATTRSSAMVSTNGGDVYVWGENNSGQLGLGNLSVVNFPLVNPAITDVDTMAGGLEHFVILRNDGTVWTIGNNQQGQLGNNALVNSLSPVQVNGLTNIVAIGAGEFHSFAIRADGTLFGWGNNSSGQLGLGNFNGQLAPAIIPLENIISAAGGANHSTFLSNTGEVFSCGGNVFGQLGINSTVSTTSPKKSLISGVKQIAVSQYNTLLLRNDFSVYGCGNNDEGQLSPEVTVTVQSPSLLSVFDGVSFIGASQHSTHVIYGESQGCSSASVSVIVDAISQATIVANGDTLTTIAGSGYQWYFNGLIIPGETNQSIIASSSGNYSVVVEFAAGCTSESDEFTHNMANLSELDGQSLKVYPNPSEDYLFIEGDLTKYDNLIVYDNTGRVVISAALNNTINTHKLITSELVRGGYHLVLEGKEEVYRTKFIKN